MNGQIGRDCGGSSTCCNEKRGTREEGRAGAAGDSEAYCASSRRLGGGDEGVVAIACGAATLRMRVESGMRSRSLGDVVKAVEGEVSEGENGINISFRRAIGTYTCTHVADKPQNRFTVKPSFVSETTFPYSSKPPNGSGWPAGQPKRCRVSLRVPLRSPRTLPPLHAACSQYSLSAALFDRPESSTF